MAVPLDGHAAHRWTAALPPGVEHSPPVVPGDRPDLRRREAGVGQRLEQLRIAGDVTERGRDRGAVEVGAKRNVLDADTVGDVANVLDDQLKRCVSGSLAKSARRK